MLPLEIIDENPNGSRAQPVSANSDLRKASIMTRTDGISRTTSTGDSTLRRLTAKRGFAMLPNARIEPRPFVKRYFFRRPRLLQYYHDGAYVDAQGRRVEALNREEFTLSNTTTDGDEDSVQPQLVEDTDDPAAIKIQRDWLNLFIDLLWVGIVSNISSSFVASAFESGRAWGDAFLEFIVLFAASYRFWSYIRKFLNNFFNKDFPQSLFLTWVLVVALFFGNQTAYFLEPAGGFLVVITFLVAKASFIFIEALYCVYIPALRREFLITSVISFPVAALWGVSIITKWPARAGLLLSALLLEGVVSAIIALPLGDWFLRGAPRKALDPENFVDRLQGFFIIVLGEGVYGLVAGNDWGLGLPFQVVYAMQALVVYYSLFWLFFTGDSTKTYIHAIYRNRYTSLAFQFFHVLLFASILVLDASIKYLIENSVPPATTGPDITPEDPAKTDTLLLARWTISASLSSTILFMTVKSLLNRSLDCSGTLFIDSRYLRMAPRAVVCVIIVCLPIKTNINSVTYFGILIGLLQPLLFWEALASMEKGWKWFESKDSGSTE